MRAHPHAARADRRGAARGGRARPSAPAARCSRPPSELAKHGDAAAGLESLAELAGRARTSAWCSAATGRSSRRCATYADDRASRCSAINFGTVGFLAAAERERARPGPRARLRRRLRGDARCPGSRPSVEADPPLALNDVSLIRRPHGRVAELAYRLGGEEVGHVRCDGLVAATPAGLDRLQPRQPGPDPRLGRGGLRGQLHRPAHAHRAAAGRRARRRALSPQRGRARPGRRRPRRRARGRAGERRRDARSASATASARSRSSRARTSTAGSARSSAASPLSR